MIRAHVVLITTIALAPALTHAATCESLAKQNAAGFEIVSATSVKPGAFAEAGSPQAHPKRSLDRVAVPRELLCADQDVDVGARFMEQGGGLQGGLTGADHGHGTTGEGLEATVIHDVRHEVLRDSP